MILITPTHTSTDKWLIGLVIAIFFIGDMATTFLIFQHAIPEINPMYARIAIWLHTDSRLVAIPMITTAKTIALVIVWWLLNHKTLIRTKMLCYFLIIGGLYAVLNNLHAVGWI